MQTEITHRRVLAVALPIVLSNITVPLLGVVDTLPLDKSGMRLDCCAVGVGRLSLGRFIGFWISAHGHNGACGPGHGGRGSAGIDRPFGAWLDPGSGAGVVIARFTRCRLQGAYGFRPYLIRLRRLLKVT